MPRGLESGGKPVRPAQVQGSGDAQIGLRDSIQDGLPAAVPRSTLHAAETCRLKSTHFRGLLTVNYSSVVRSPPHCSSGSVFQRCPRNGQRQGTAMAR